MFLGSFEFIRLVSLIALIYLCWRMRSDKDFYIKVIKWRNKIQGVETKITSETIKWGTLGASLGIIVGSIILLVSIRDFLRGLLLFFFS